ncbi:outer membrane beta-barrel protein [Pontibacter oryzae]|uniref:TonB-dependent receptor n=1 Tax=Pontibacter oryzae TaxID=2304593 RepID=A0A399SJ01_9BACT|nr:outer membrane beta-barrel protein [Pontibacter oryzae]RIJ41725.1 TonB-dependent receptor [Pontibacter oryzae]
MKRLLSALILVMVAVQVYAQNAAVYGTVQSSSDNTALPGANVVLIKATDASKLATVSGPDGKFRFESVGTGQYTVEINYIGFEKYNRSIQVQGTALNLGQLALKDGSTSIKEVQIIGRAPLGEQKGDTTQFNAKAFKTAPDASAEELVTKMPGVTIQDGKVQAQGEDVKQVMIDGKRYTGEDVSSAMRNISADMVESVQVFDAPSDRAAFSGFDDGNRIKTLNFVTKQSKKQGYVGKVSAGYGTDERYMVGAAVNYFNNNQRITVTGLTNNINMFDFSVGETPGGSMRGRRGGFGRSTPSGITKTDNFGINYNDMWGKKVEVSANYNYNQREITNNRYTFRDYVNNDTTYVENSINRSKDDAHRLNFRLQYNINENNRLLITPSITLQQNNDLTTRFANTFAGDNTLTTSNNSTSADATSLSVNNNILYSHRFGDSGRILTANFSTSYGASDSDTYQLQDTRNLDNEERNVNKDQYFKQDQNNLSWSGNLDYSEKLGENSRLQLEYGISNQINDADRRTFDLMEDSGEYTGFNPSLSNTFESNYLSQSIGPTYQYRTDKVSMQVGARYQYATLDSESEFPVADPIKRNFSNILPSAEYEYKFSRSKNLRISLRTNTDVPSVSQLQEVLDISNPLQLKTGNPELDQAYQNRINIRYRNFSPETNRVFFAGLFGTITQNYIGNSVYTNGFVPVDLPEGYELQPGARFTRPVNLDGYWNVRSFVNYGQPLNFISSNFNMFGSVGFTRIPGEINGVINYANTTNFGGGLNISSNISEKVDFNISTNSNYNIVSNTTSGNPNNNYFTQNTSLRYNWIMWKGLVYRTEMSHQYNSGLSEGVDKSYLLWNMSIGKKVFKNQKGEVSISVNDLLKQNVSIERSISSDYVEDVQSTVLQRFFMLTFSYNINKFKSGAAPEEQDRRGGWEGRRN